MAILTSTQKQITTKQVKADPVTHNRMKWKYVGPLNVDDVDWLAWVIQLSSLVDGAANASHWTLANAKPKEYSVYTKQANNKLTISPWPSLVLGEKTKVYLSINMSNQQQYSLKKHLISEALMFIVSLLFIMVSTRYWVGHFYKYFSFTKL